MGHDGYTVERFHQVNKQSITSLICQFVLRILIDSFSNFEIYIITNCSVPGSAIDH
jgi:hypothetical protein